MKRRPIGFHSYDNESREDEQDKQDELREEQIKRQKAIADFIGHNYSPLGETSAKCYKATVELVYDLSNIIAVRSDELAKQLSDAGYQIEYLANQPYWVMYEK